MSTARVGSAPPVYRPQPQRMMQLKPSAIPKTQQGAPPVYRPMAQGVTQAFSRSVRPATGGAPPGYRPQAGHQVQRMAAPPLYRPAAPVQGKQVVQRVQSVPGAGKTHHMKYGDFWKSDADLP
ncbi:MAG: hypothetical protein ABI380_13050, partial [Edaphobacter sp.]